MQSEENNLTSAETPATFTGLKLGHVKNKAAGIPAVMQSFKHVFGEAGILRGMKALGKLNQFKGFDCPSCAWPDPDDERSGIAEYCENGAKAVAEEATAKQLTASFFEEHSVQALSMLSDYELGRKGRIAVPLYLAAGATHYREISWDEAFKGIAQHLQHLNSPDEAVFYTSGRTSNEAAFLYQLFVREYGTNNLPDCSNMCHESSGVALGESLGIGKGSVTLEDFYQAEVIMILGQNPGTNHPRMLTALQKAKANGAVIIAINPLPEAGLMGFDNPQKIKGVLGIDSALTDLFLQVRLNGDMPLLQAIERLLLQAEKNAPGTVFDNQFIARHTEGVDQLLKHLENLDPSLLQQQSGVDQSQIEEAAQILKNSNKIIVCWAMGLTQHKNAVDTIKEIVNLLLLKGSIGKPGAGTCPVRGHSNVQGDRTMGIFEKPAGEFLDRLQQHYRFDVPRKHGYDVVDCIHAMHEGKAKLFIAMGGNFLSATPDTNYTAAALRKCVLTVQVSTKLNRSHLVHGKEAYILPSLARSDKDEYNGKLRFVSCENSMGVVQQSRGVLSPVSKLLLSEPVIICRLAMATLKNTMTDWQRFIDDYDNIREDIEIVIPGFEEYNRRVRLQGGFYLPNCNREQRFDTSNSKAQFTVNNFLPVIPARDELMMMTIRSHDQFNTTIYGLDDRYRGIYNERRVVMMNQADMNQHGFQPGEVVDLVNDENGVERRASKFIVVPYPIPEGCCATYFPETNVLVPITSVAEKSNTPVSKLVLVRVVKSSATTADA